MIAAAASHISVSRPGNRHSRSRTSGVGGPGQYVAQSSRSHTYAATSGSTVHGLVLRHPPVVVAQRQRARAPAGPGWYPAGQSQNAAAVAGDGSAGTPLSSRYPSTRVSRTSASQAASRASHSMSRSARSSASTMRRQRAEPAMTSRARAGRFRDRLRHSGQGQDVVDRVVHGERAAPGQPAFPRHLHVGACHLAERLDPGGLGHHYNTSAHLAGSASMSAARSRTG